jgi:DNA modification methylase
MSTCRLLIGDVRETLAQVPDGSVQCAVTSPPYWGLRDYGEPDQLGLEPTPEEYVANMVAVFREVRRVLRDDGVLWLNLGDSYTGGKQGRDDGHRRNTFGVFEDGEAKPGHMAGTGKNRPVPTGMKPKDLVGIPWRVAFALQADGWYLRSDIIWHKPNPMPESVTDRPTKSHEYLFLLSKSPTYFYDADAIAEAALGGVVAPAPSPDKVARITPSMGTNGTGARTLRGSDTTRNARSVWTITTKPYPGAHFATFPPELAERCIKAGSKPGDTVLDPFAGSGTTGMVATGHGRRAVLCELNPAYADLIVERVGPMLMEAA